MLTLKYKFDKITLAFGNKHNSERYRSGHNEAVLKTVCPKGRMGSNPILSAFYFYSNIDCINLAFWRSTQEAEGTPLERVQVVNSGARVQIPPSPLKRVPE